MEKFTNKYDTDEYSTLIEFETNIFRQNIDILKSRREILWISVFRGTTAFLIPYLGDIYGMLEDLTSFRQYASDEVYDEFVKEYYMTMYLLRKCLIKSVNEDLLPPGEEEKLKIKELISRIGSSQLDNENMEAVIGSLKSEGHLIQKALEGLGMSQEKIKEIMASGYAAESVLDVEPISKSIK